MTPLSTTADDRPPSPPATGQRAETPAEPLPGYAPLLTAFHEEFATELQGALELVPVRSGAQALDLACGDGQYAAWLARRVGPEGSVTAVDASRAWLHTAASTLANEQVPNARLCQADARQLPFNDGSFDLVWCAQSLYSLPNTSRCLSEMVRVLRPGGVLAILEDDTLHHVLLPWPVDLELEVRAAELAAFRQEANSRAQRRPVSQPARYYVGRWLSRLLRQVGLTRVRERPIAAIRQAPLTPAAMRFFTEYLQNLRQRVAPLLARSVRRHFEPLVDPASRRFLPRQSDFVALCLDRLVWGSRPLSRPAAEPSPRRLAPRARKA